ncbi:MAG: hypothetical protein ACLP8S_30150 [Solirubrobacteraceae bacterium]
MSPSNHRAQPPLAARTTPARLDAFASPRDLAVVRVRPERRARIRRRAHVREGPFHNTKASVRERIPQPWADRGGRRGLRDRARAADRRGGARPGQRADAASTEAKHKWLTASVVEDAATVVADIFDEAERRDGEHERTWVALVDGSCRRRHEPSNADLADMPTLL